MKGLAFARFDNHEEEVLSIIAKVIESRVGAEAVLKALRDNDFELFKMIGVTEVEIL